MKNTLLKLSLFIGISLMFTLPAYAQSVTTGDLVNTESFFIINDYDTDVNIELQFGDTIGELLFFDPSAGIDRFEFTDDLYIQGNLELEGESLKINTDGTASDSTLDFNDGDGTIQYNNATDDFTVSDDVNVTGDVNADGDLLLDADDTSGDVTIQFGTTLAEVIQWDNGNSRFNISDDLYIDGTLEVNGDVDFNQNLAVEMVIDQGTAFPGGPVEGQVFYRTDLDTFYVYDGSSWVALADVSGSNTIFLSPLYPHSTYYGDGFANIGRLTYQFDAANIENSYRWETSRPTDQDYDVKVRIQLPDNFSDWATNPIEFKYRTDTTTATDNQLDFTMLDTSDAAVTMSNNTGLASSVANTWVESTNMTITGGTWNPGGWFTVTIKLTADNGGGAEAGSLVFNYDTNN